MWSTRSLLVDPIRVSWLGTKLIEVESSELTGGGKEGVITCASGCSLSVQGPLVKQELCQEFHSVLDQSLGWVRHHVYSQRHNCSPPDQHNGLFHGRGRWSVVECFPIFSCSMYSNFMWSIMFSISTDPSNLQVASGSPGCAQRLRTELQRKGNLKQLR